MCAPADVEAELARVQAVVVWVLEVLRRAKIKAIDVGWASEVIVQLLNVAPSGYVPGELVPDPGGLLTALDQVLAGAEVRTLCLKVPEDRARLHELVAEAAGR